MAKTKNATYWIGFDLGGTKMLAALLDARFRVMATERKKTRAREGQEAGLQRIGDTIQAALDAGGVTAGQLGGIGIGSPGPLDLRRGLLLQAPNLGWTDMPLRDALSKRFGCPVTLANDVDVGTFGEFRHGAARKARCVLGVFPGTGIGGACVYDGRILRGRSRSCLEIGHVKVMPDGPLCGCGRTGCLEALASRLAISAEAAKAVHRGEAPALAALAGTDLASIRSGALAKAVAEGDAVVERILRRAAGAIGRAIADAVNLLAPDSVVLGGGLVDAMPDLFLQECTAAAEASVMPPFIGQFKIVVAALGDHAGVIGAAALAAHPEAIR